MGASFWDCYSLRFKRSVENSVARLGVIFLFRQPACATDIVTAINTAIRYFLRQNSDFKDSSWYSLLFMWLNAGEFR